MLGDLSEELRQPENQAAGRFEPGADLCQPVDAAVNTAN